MVRTEDGEDEELARGFALEAHHGQVDRSGSAYALHLATVAGLVEPGQQRAAAWLHDVLEDTSRTADDLLRIGIDPETVGIVISLTRTKESTYDEHIEQVARSGADAVAVKRADLAEHLGRPAGLNQGLKRRYQRAVRRLAEETERGRWPAAGVAPERLKERRGRHEQPTGAKTGTALVTDIGRQCTEVTADLERGEATESQVWALLQQASRTLDHLHPVERAAEREGAYATVAHAPGKEPKAGTNLAEFPALGTIVEIDSVWPLPDRARRNEHGPTRIAGLKLSLSVWRAESSAAPRNYESGFYGAWNASEGLGHGVTAEEAWLAVLVVHGFGGRATAQDRHLREVLDTTGQEYAERVLEELKGWRYSDAPRAGDAAGHGPAHGPCTPARLYAAMEKIGPPSMERARREQR